MRIVPTLVAVIALLALVTGSAADGAENLALRKGISFNTDSDRGFPIVADKMEDTSIEKGRTTFLFFGAAGDLNTSRQAKRVVKLYDKFGRRGVKFIIIDVDKPVNSQARALIKRHYKGYIPSQVILDNTGKKTWSHAGEVSERQVARVLNSKGRRSR